jgi:hypothetical protein
MKIGWRGALGFVLSAAFLVWTMREVSFAQVWGVLRQSSLPLFLLSATVATLIFPLRALRWRVILEPIAHDIPFGRSGSTAVGMMVNNVFPARAGELAAPTRSRARSPANFAAAFASLAVDRIFDAVTVVILLVTAMIFSDFPPETTIGGQPINRVAMGTGLLAVGAWPASSRWRCFLAGGAHLGWRRGSNRPSLRGSRPALARIIHVGTGRATVTGSLREGPRWAIVMWLVNGLSFWIGFLAVGIEGAVHGRALPDGGHCDLGRHSVVARLLRSLEAAGTGRPHALQCEERPGRLVALGFHLLAFLPITLIGLFYFARLGMKFGELGQQAAGDDEGRRPA